MLIGAFLRLVDDGTADGQSEVALGMLILGVGLGTFAASQTRRVPSLAELWRAHPFVVSALGLIAFLMLLSMIAARVDPPPDR